VKLPVIAVGVALVVAIAVVGGVWALGGLGDDEPAATRTTPSADESFPEGVFRYRLTKQEVLRLVPDMQPRLLKDAVGTFTWTIRDGTISLHQTDCDCTFDRISAPYTATPSLLTVTWPSKAENGADFCTGDCVETLSWTFDGKALRLTPLEATEYDIVFWGARKPWAKID
jgi:hypothetical protein